jgi:hypothetical protein
VLVGTALGFTLPAGLRVASSAPRLSPLAPSSCAYTPRKRGGAGRPSCTGGRWCGAGQNRTERLRWQCGGGDRPQGRVVPTGGCPGDRVAASIMISVWCWRGGNCAPTTSPRILAGTLRVGILLCMSAYTAQAQRCVCRHGKCNATGECGDCDCGYTGPQCRTKVTPCFGDQAPDQFIPDHAGVGSCGDVLAACKSCTPDCDSGYQLTGEIKCSDAGTDLTHTAKCEPDPCDALAMVGDHMKKGDCTASLPSGQSCTPVCDTGYTLSGTRTCKLGHLSPDTVSCAPDPCDASAVVGDHMKKGDCTASLPSGQSCTPICDTGYTLSGPLTCTAGTLKPNSVQCTANQCTPLSVPHSDHADPASKCTGGTGDVCKYTCDATDAEKYSVGGRTGTRQGSTTCQATGSFDFKPIPGGCLPDPCDASGPIEHGKAGPKCKATMPSGKSCSPTCDKGWHLSGQRSCGAGELTDTATCGSPDDCTDPSVSKIPVHGTNVGNCTTPLNSGRSCTPACGAGYTLVGRRSCLAGQLTDTTKCEPDPCDALAKVGDHMKKGGCTASLPSGKSCTPICDTGYTLSGPLTCTAGTLKPNSVQCTANQCTPLSVPHSDHADPASKCTGGTGDVCTYECDYSSSGRYSVGGHTGTRKGSTTCQATGSFDFIGKNHCLPDPCPPPLDCTPQHGGPGNCKAELLDGQNCTPSCDDGYNNSYGECVCHAGIVTHTFQCGDPEPCDASAVVGDHMKKGNCTASLPSGQSCTPVCDPGYTLSGPLTCTAGTLKPNNVQCTANQCTPLSVPHSDHADPASKCTGGTGDVCTYTCDATDAEKYSVGGHTGKRQGSTTCQATGSFDFKPIPGGCLPDPCDISEKCTNPQHGGPGNCTASSLPDGHQCKPSCKSGYSSSGQCMCHAGNLKGSPQCEADSCDAMMCGTKLCKWDNGGSGTCSNNLASNDTCTPNCDFNYEPNGTKVRKCFAGKLTGVVICVMKKCHNASKPPGGGHGHAGNCPATLPADADCTPVCDPGYVLTGSRRCKGGSDGLQDKTGCRACSSECAHDGICVGTENDYTCKNCSLGWIGDTCQIPDQCFLTHPCEHGGNCTMAPNIPKGYTCNCTDTGYSGYNCERALLNNWEWLNIGVSCAAVLPAPYIYWQYKRSLRRLRNPRLPATKQALGTFGLLQFLFGVVDLVVDIGLCIALSNCKQWVLFACCVTILVVTTLLTWTLGWTTLKHVVTYEAARSATVERLV